jgi:peptide/nickel transport system permease protein
VLRFLARRALRAAAIVLIVSSASFLLARLAPGDFVETRLGPGASRDLVARERARYGLDRPLASHYFSWLAGALRFDFGRSLAFDRPVAAIVPERAGNTALVAASAFALALLLGIPLGVVSGSRPRGRAASLVRAVSVVLLSAPPLLTTMGLVFVAAGTGWLPAGGMTSAAGGPGGIAAGGGADIARHMIVPVLALALPVAALFERLQAEAMAAVVGEPFVAAARARGASWRRIVWRDGLRPSLGPVASMSGLVAGSLLSGSFAVEVVAAWPGLGRLTLDALRMRDPYLVAGCAAAGSIFLALGLLLSDAVLAVIDPRVRDSG